jgi:hypothetical protein
VYVLVGAGAISLLLASHALAAGPLAASQPGFTILDPLSASLLGLFLFGEHFQTGIDDLALEALALALLVAGVSALSHSHLIQGEDEADGAEASVARHAGAAAARPASDQLTEAQRLTGTPHLTGGPHLTGTQPRDSTRRSAG